MKARLPRHLRGLILSRRAGDIISVNHGELLIGITEVKGGSVRLIFEANKEIRIERYEQYLENLENKACKPDCT